MQRDAETDFIVVDTNYDGIFKVTITLPNKHVIFSDSLASFNKKIRLNGFSLNKHTVIISPLTQKVL